MQHQQAQIAMFKKTGEPAAAAEAVAMRPVLMVLRADETAGLTLAAMPVKKSHIFGLLIFRCILDISKILYCQAQICSLRKAVV